MLAKAKPPRIRVLVIDDSRLVRIAATKMFGDEFDVLLAVDGADGWNIIQRDPDIQVVFTDLVMPEMDGFELLKLIRTSNKASINGLPVIVATGADNPEVAKQKAISLGATDFITKPFNSTGIKARALSYAKFHETNKRLQEQTTFDVVTGLSNAKGMYRQLDKEVAFVARHHSSMTVMSLEVDGFKDMFINVGRAGAEAIIKKIAVVLADTVRKEDTVARMGVSTFAVSMPLAQGENALELADRICRTVENFKAKLDGKRLKITVSIGVCVYEGDHLTDANTVFEVADGALQKAMSIGRSQIFQMTIKDYLDLKDQHKMDNLSIDLILDQIKDNQHSLVVPTLDLALERLSPMFELLSNEQKQRILTAH